MPAVLVWKQSSTRPVKDGTNAVTAYASQSLSKAESHYPAHKLEFLALKQAVANEIPQVLVWVDLQCVY